MSSISNGFDLPDHQEPFINLWRPDQDFNHLENQGWSQVGGLEGRGRTEQGGSSTEVKTNQRMFHHEFHHDCIINLINININIFRYVDLTAQLVSKHGTA